jgi:hypothetical protein
MRANGTQFATAHDMPLIAIKATVNLKRENKSLENGQRQTERLQIW